METWGKIKKRGKTTCGPNQKKEKGKIGRNRKMIERNQIAETQNIVTDQGEIKKELNNRNQNQWKKANRKIIKNRNQVR
jgi:hypothetical protein